MRACVNLLHRRSLLDVAPRVKEKYHQKRQTHFYFLERGSSSCFEERDVGRSLSRPLFCSPLRSLVRSFFYLVPPLLPPCPRRSAPAARSAGQARAGSRRREAHPDLASEEEEESESAKDESATANKLLLPSSTRLALPLEPLSSLRTTAPGTSLPSQSFTGCCIRGASGTG